VLFRRPIREPLPFLAMALMAYAASRQLKVPPPNRVALHWAREWSGTPRPLSCTFPCAYEDGLDMVHFEGCFAGSAFPPGVAAGYLYITA
jgi:hypothetical protein